VRKENPKMRWHVTDEEKARIVAMTKEGKLQKEISAAIGVGRDVVARWQKRLGLREAWKGLPTRPKTPPQIPEEEILRLFKLDWNGYKIARHLHISVPRVYAVAEKYGFVRNRERGHRAKGDIKAFCEAVQLRLDHVKHLAPRFGVSLGTAYPLAHAIRGVAKFKGGPASPPMSSVYPQKHYPGELHE
jgi:transposase